MAMKKTTRTLGYVLLGFVMIGLMAFGSTNFGGSAQAIGKVGKTDIPAQRYYTELRNTLAALNAQTGQQMSFAEAKQLGIDQIALARVVAETADDDEAARIGLSVGDETLRNRLLQQRDFFGPGGSFDRDTYDFVLEQNGLTPGEYESILRKDITRGLLQRAIASGAALPEIYAEKLYAEAREGRSFTWAMLGLEALETEPGAPDEATLEAWYNNHEADYTLPEIRHVTYLWADPQAFLDQVEVNEADLRALYESHRDRYVQPERRLVERLVFGTMEEAQAARDAIDAGEKDFADLVAERGFQLSDVDLGDVTRADLGPAADAVFALTEPGIAGPVQSNLGPALFRMNGILAAQETSFEAARPELVAELAGDAARRMISDLMGELDDLMAGGATLEELAREYPALKLGTLDWRAGDEDGLAAYEPVRTRLAQLQEGDFPELEPLDDGGLFALRLDKLDPPRLQSLDEVRLKVIEDWRAAERKRLIVEQAREMLPVLDSGAESPASLGLTEIAETGLTRDALVEGAPPELIDAMFAADAPGKWQVVEAPGGAILARLDAIIPADLNSEEAKALIAGYSQRMSQELALDIQTAFGQALQAEAGIQLDQGVIAAVNAQLP